MTGDKVLFQNWCMDLLGMKKKKLSDAYKIGSWYLRGCFQNFHAALLVKIQCGAVLGGHPEMIAEACYACLKTCGSYTRT